jgi:hypothetical protein
MRVRAGEMTVPLLVTLILSVILSSALQLILVSAATISILRIS